MPSFTEHLGFHASALQLRSRRNEMLASNIANAATPNFKARDLDFDTELKRINKIGNIQTTNNSHLALKIKHTPLLQYLLPVGCGPSSKI